LAVVVRMLGVRLGDADFVFGREPRTIRRSVDRPPKHSPDIKRKQSDIKKRIETQRGKEQNNQDKIHVIVQPKSSKIDTRDNSRPTMFFPHCVR
jgi:hypothetical protein